MNKLKEFLTVRKIFDKQSEEKHNGVININIISFTYNNYTSLLHKFSNIYDKTKPRKFIKLANAG